MDAHAVELAKDRLARAKRALAELKAATNYAEAESAWTDFLMAAGSIYSKLDRGSLANGKSRAWFGRKKNERRSDHLLRYLHFARNSDEHGIERTTRRDKGNLTGFGNKPLKFGEKVEIYVAKVDPETNEEVGERVPGYLPGPGLQLVTARDNRYGDSCDPPTSHLGKEIVFHYPDLAAEAAIAYLDGLVAEAATLV